MAALKRLVVEQEEVARLAARRRSITHLNIAVARSPRPESWGLPTVLLRPLTPMAGSSYFHPFSSSPIARAGGVLRISIRGYQGAAIEEEEDGRVHNAGRPPGVHVWKRLRID